MRPDRPRPTWPVVASTPKFGHHGTLSCPFQAPLFWGHGPRRTLSPRGARPSGPLVMFPSLAYRQSLCTVRPSLRALHPARGLRARVGRLSRAAAPWGHAGSSRNRAPKPGTRHQVGGKVKGRTPTARDPALCAAPPLPPPARPLRLDPASPAPSSARTAPRRDPS